MSYLTKNIILTRNALFATFRLMDQPRFYTPPSTREIIKSTKWEHFPPTHVMESTSAALGEYFSGDPARREVQILLRDSISHVAYPFMKLVQLGAMLDFDKTRKLSKEDTKLALQFMEPLKTETPKDSAIEAFRFAMVTLASMPEVVDQKYYKKEDALKREAVKPAPQTTIQLLKRLAEIQEVLREIYWGQIPRNYDGQTKAAAGQERIFRTLFFFETGKDLPINSVTEKEELANRMHEQLKLAQDRINFEHLMKSLGMDDMTIDL